MQGIYPTEGVADKQVQGVGRVTAVDSLISTVVYVLAEACFPLIIRGALTVCLVRNERGDRFGRTFLRQVTLVGETVVEELIRVTHTDILINRVMIDTRHTYGGTQSIDIILQFFADNVLFMHNHLQLVLHHWRTILRRQIGLIGQHELMIPTEQFVSVFLFIHLRVEFGLCQIRIGFFDRLLSAGHVVQVPIHVLRVLGERCLERPFDGVPFTDLCSIQTLMVLFPLVPLPLVPPFLQTRCDVIGLRGHDVAFIGYEQGVLIRIRGVTQGI